MRFSGSSRLNCRNSRCQSACRLQSYHQTRTAMKTLARLTLTILGLLAVVPQPQAAHAPRMKDGKAVDTRMAMRKLWEDHITYTRNYIISALANLPDGDAVAQRLLKNQDDIGDAIKPFYGADAGKKLAALLR